MSSKSNKIPLYSQLVDKLIEEIEKMEPGDMIESERRLCEIHDLSRTTVRQAISELELNGYITRIHGKGTFVTRHNTAKHNLTDYYSFTDQMKAFGKVPKTMVLEYHIERCNQNVAKKMGIETGDRIIRFLRLRLADDVPMMMETTIIPYKDFTEITKQRLEELPLYEIFSKDYNREIAFVEEQFAAGLLGKEEAINLSAEYGSPCLKLQRISRDKNDKIIEFTISSARADQFIYKVAYHHK